MVFHITSPGIIQIFSQRKLFSPTARSQRPGRHKTQFSFLFGKPTVDKHPTGKKEVYKCRG